MAKRKVRATIVRKNELQSWIFVLFLTLALVFLVIVLTAMRNMTYGI